MYVSKTKLILSSLFLIQIGCDSGFESYVAKNSDLSSGFNQITPSPSPRPTSSPTPSPNPSSTPNPTSSPTPSPTSSPSPTPTSTPIATPTPPVVPSATPRLSPTPNPTASPTPRPTATATPSPTATPIPVPSGTSTADLEWHRRRTQSGVIISEGYDTIQSWASATSRRSNTASGSARRFRLAADVANCRPEDLSSDSNGQYCQCDPDYYRTYTVNGVTTRVGCHRNTFDNTQSASGGGSVRFDITSQSSGNHDGEVRLWFSGVRDDGSVRFLGGTQNSDMWISWRQRFDDYFITHNYLEGDPTAPTSWKQVIVADASSDACSNNEIVVNNEKEFSTIGYPQTYNACGYYTGFTSSSGSRVTEQNQRLLNNGTFGCAHHGGQPPETSACKFYRPNQWMTFTMRVRLSADHETFDYEFYVADEGRPYEAVHKQTGIRTRDTSNVAYRGFAKLLLLAYMTGKSSAEIHQDSSTWYDEVIVSRECIPAPFNSCPDGSKAYNGPQTSSATGR